MASTPWLRWCAREGEEQAALAGAHSQHRGAFTTAAKKDESYSHHDAQSVEMWHVQWFGGPVENASGTSLQRMHS